MALLDGLLDAVKNYLDITWVDSASDEKLTGIVARGMKYIDGIAGTSLDYLTDDKPKELLFEYCRYVWSDGFAEFQSNYLHELLSLQQIEQVKAYEG